MAAAAGVAAASESVVANGVDELIQVAEMVQRPSKVL